MATIVRRDSSHSAGGGYNESSLLLSLRLPWLVLAPVLAFAMPLLVSLLLRNTSSSSNPRTRSDENSRASSFNNNKMDHETCNDDDDKRDQVFLAQAHELRLALNPPRQSQFRVVALLVLENGTVIQGTNDEPSPSISGAICAERAAFLQWRLLYARQQEHQQQQCQEKKATTAKVKVKRIYIVTDAQTPIPPGLLCREYMYGHDEAITHPADTTFVLQSQDPKSTPWKVTLRELYPHPPIYMGMTVQDQVVFGEKYQKQQQQDEDGRCLPNWLLREERLNHDNNDNNSHHKHHWIITHDLVKQVFWAAYAATEWDHRDYVHAIRYGAATAVVVRNTNASDDTADCYQIQVLNASQRKALEYGASQDAVCRLLSSHVIWSSVEVLLIVQVDQFGIPHAPYAPARSLLVEHGLGQVYCLTSTAQSKRTTDSTSDIVLQPKLVRARDLAPFVPEFRS